MRHLRNRPAIALLIALSLFAASCGPKKLREARKAAHRIQVVVDAATDSLVVLHSKGFVDDAKTRTVAVALLKVNEANAVLIAHAKAATVDDAPTRAALLNDLQAVIQAVEALKAAGILGIKSETGSLAFESAVNALNTSIEILRGVLA